MRLEHLWFSSGKSGGRKTFKDKGRGGGTEGEESQDLKGKKENVCYRAAQPVRNGGPKDASAAVHDANNAHKSGCFLS